MGLILNNYIYRYQDSDGSNGVDCFTYDTDKEPKELVKGWFPHRRLTQELFNGPAMSTLTAPIRTNDPDGNEETIDADVVIYLGPAHYARAYGMFYRGKFMTNVDFCPYDLKEYIHDDAMYNIVDSDGYSYDGIGHKAYTNLRQAFTEARVDSLDGAKQIALLNLHLVQVYINSLPPEYQGVYFQLLVVSAYCWLG
jgi:hypothetical protein